MRLPDVATLFLAGWSDKLARLRRDLVCYSIVGICLMVSAFFATSAGLMALEQVVGPIYARLIVAGIFIVIALLTLLIVRLGTVRVVRVHAAAPADATTAAAAAAAVGPRPERGTKPQLSQIAMIVEAVMLGYSLSRKDRR